MGSDYNRNVIGFASVLQEECKQIGVKSSWKDIGNQL